MRCNCDRIPVDYVPKVVYDITVCDWRDAVFASRYGCNFFFVNNAVEPKVRGPLFAVMVIDCHLTDVFFEACCVSILLHRYL